MAHGTIGIDLLHNVALLLALAALQWVLFRSVTLHRGAGAVASGLLFGFTAVAVMSVPFALEPGMIFDVRGAVLSIGALFGGPIAAAVAAAVAGTARLWIGGAGAWVGFGNIVLASLLGLALRAWLDRHGRPMLRTRDLLLLGGVNSALTLAMFAFLPLDFRDHVLNHLALPYVLATIASTVLLALLLQAMLAARDIDRVLAGQERRFERLFQSAAVSMWDEDMSGLIQLLRHLRHTGVTDLRRHLAENPELVARLTREIAVTNVNEASLALFEADSPDHLLTEISTTWGPGAEAVFVDSLCAIWDGMDRFAGDAAFTTLRGKPLFARISYPIPKTEEDARQVPVSIVDLTERRAAELALVEERRRLDEIIWGTNVGTWEWNVPTGDAVFNERWAEIVGYTLAELAPIDIATWERLCHPDDLKASEAQLDAVFRRERDHYDVEVRMRHKTGDWVWVQDRGKVVEWDAAGNPIRMSGTHTDITAKKQAEERLARLAAIRNAIVLCQGAILRSDDESRLLQETCDILIATRDYALVWVGLPQQDATRTIKPVAAAGSHADYATDLVVHGIEDSHGTGPTGRALRSGRIQVQRDLATDDSFKHWSDRAGTHGFRCSVAVPGIGKSGLVLLLNVYSSADEAFDSDEMTLLSTFANSLALAMEHMGTLREKERIGGALARSAFNAVNAIAKTIEKRDPYTSGHQERVATLAVAIARRLGWPEDRVDGLRLGAMIHDIGKIYIPAEILNRPGRLTEGEMTIIRTHPEVGGEILDGIEFPWPIKEMVEQHHERPDGTGYPRGLKGDAILAEAKIIAVADVVEAIAAHRPYRPARGIAMGLDEIRRGRGTIYDPAIADACLELIERQGFDWAA